MCRLRLSSRLWFRMHALGHHMRIGYAMPACSCAVTHTPHLGCDAEPVLCLPARRPSGCLVAHVRMRAPPVELPVLSCHGPGAGPEIASSAHGCEFASAAQRVGGGETVRVRVTCFSSIFEEAGHTDGHTLPCPPKGRAPVMSSPGVLCPVS